MLMDFSRTKGFACLFICFCVVPSFIMAFAQNSDSTTYTKSQIEGGKQLFTGQTRFSNGGPACISCHSLSDPHLPVSGGTFSVNITPFGVLQEAALKERIIRVSLPHMTVMKKAFQAHPVTESESERIIAYMKYVNQLDANKVKSPLSASLFLWSGMTGVLLIYGLILLVWNRRKKHSVNRSIYERQIQSV